MFMKGMRVNINLRSVTVKLNQENYEAIKNGLVTVEDRNTMYNQEEGKLTAGELIFIVDDNCSNDLKESDISEVEVEVELCQK